MSDAPDPCDELTERLRAMGRQSIDPARQSQHLMAMAAVPGAASWRSMLASRVKLGGAVAAGFLLGATGLASAGAMGPLQPIAKTAVEAVTPFELPAASDEGQADARAAEAEAEAEGRGDAAGVPEAAKHWGPECDLTLDGVPVSQRNRGQFLKDVRENGTPDQLAAARKSDCGKSVDALRGTEDADAGGAETTDTTARTKDDRDRSRGKTRSGATADDGVHDERREIEGGKSGITPPPSSTPATTTPAADRGDGARGDRSRGDRSRGERARNDRARDTAADEVDGAADDTEDGPADPADPDGTGS